MKSEGINFKKSIFVTKGINIAISSPNAHSKMFMSLCNEFEHLFNHNFELLAYESCNICFSSSTF